MTMMRFVIPAAINTLADDEVQVVMSTSDLARDGHVLIASGADLANYRRNPIVLWQHSPDDPIGNADNIVVSGNQISARIRFAPLGISQKADEVRGLMKAGVVRAVSVGFDPIKMEPLDRNKPRGGQRITKWDLLELSAVSVGADVNALVTARSQRAGKVLSGANAAAVREAHQLAEQCRAKLASVLDGAGEGTKDAARRRRELEVLRLAGLAHGYTLSEDYKRRQRELRALTRRR